MSLRRVVAHRLGYRRRQDGQRDYMNGANQVTVSRQADGVKEDS
jgi:hypothetical protein